MAAWEAEGVHPPPLLPTAANWSTTSTAITCPTSTSHPILTHLFAFSLGSLTTFLVLTLAMVVFIHWLPYYIYPVKAKRGFTPPRRGAKRRPRGGEEHSCSPVVEVVVPDTVAENADEQLQMRGWIRWSVRVLTVAELSELDGSEDGAISGGGWRGGRKSRTFTQASKDIVVSASKSAHTMYSVTRSVGSYLINRFRGQQLSDAYVPPPPPPAPTAPPRPPSWHTAFAVLKYKTLHLYTSEDCTECTDVLAVSDFVIDLYPPQPARGGTDLDIYLRTNPIRLTPKDPHHHHASPHIAGGRPLFIYCPTNSDKEDWHVMLRRAKKLPANADEGACSVFFQDSPPVRAYRAAMEKLTKTIHANTTQSPHDVSSAWLNALVGRAFVGIHSNPALKRWVLEKLSRRSMHYHRDEGDQPGAASFLGDIVVQDINVGNSVPVLSNPHLLELSVDGDMTIEMDVEYTGGVRIEAATLATISIDTLNHLAPLQVPIVVGVQIVHFAARIVIKVKGMWETNRMWVGIQQDPPVKLEMKVEPLVGHKLVSVGLVNQVIERRIKEVLEEFFVVPNLEDVGFWPSGGRGGMFWGGGGRKKKKKSSKKRKQLDFDDDSDEMDEWDEDEDEDEDEEEDEIDPATLAHHHRHQRHHHADHEDDIGDYNYPLRTGTAHANDDYNYPLRTGTAHANDDSQSDTHSGGPPGLPIRPNSTSSSDTESCSSDEDDEDEDDPTVQHARRVAVEAARMGEAVESSVRLRPRLRKRRTFESLVRGSRERLDRAGVGGKGENGEREGGAAVVPNSVVDPFSTRSVGNVVGGVAKSKQRVENTIGLTTSANEHTSPSQHQQGTSVFHPTTTLLIDTPTIPTTAAATTTTATPKPPSPPWYYETLGTAADYLGRASRHYGVDDTVNSLAKTAASYALPVVETATERLSAWVGGSGSGKSGDGLALPPPLPNAAPNSGAEMGVSGESEEEVGEGEERAEGSIGSPPTRESILTTATGATPRTSTSLATTASTHSTTPTTAAATSSPSPSSSTPTPKPIRTRCAFSTTKQRPPSMMADMTPVLQMMGLSIHTRQPSSLAAVAAGTANGVVGDMNQGNPSAGGGGGGSATWSPKGGRLVRGRGRVRGKSAEDVRVEDGGGGVEAGPRQMQDEGGRPSQSLSPPPPPAASQPLQSAPPISLPAPQDPQQQDHRPTAPPRVHLAPPQGGTQGGTNYCHPWNSPATKRKHPIWDSHGGPGRFLSRSSSAPLEMLSARMRSESGDEDTRDATMVRQERQERQQEGKESEESERSGDNLEAVEVGVRLVATPSAPVRRGSEPTSPTTAGAMFER